MSYDFTSLIDRKGKDALAVEGLGWGFGPRAPKEGFAISSFQLPISSSASAENTSGSAKFQVLSMLKAVLSMPNAS